MNRHITVGTQSRVLAADLSRLLRRGGTRRSGFTITELLVVIAIISVLAGIAIPAVMMAVSSAYEFRISARISQLDTAIESFRNEKSVYPPDQYYDPDGSAIQWLDPEASDATLLPLLVQRYGPLLQQIAPNHREFQPAAGAFPGTNFPIVAWYRQRGQFLNPTNALNFWLGGGLSNSSIYPLSEFCRRSDELPVTNASANTIYQNRTAMLKPLIYFEFTTESIDPLGYWVGSGGNRWTDGTHAGQQFYFAGDVPLFLRSAAQESSTRPLLYFVDTLAQVVPNTPSANTLFAPYILNNSVGMKFVNVGPNETAPMTPIGYGAPPAVTMFAAGKFQIIAPGRDQSYGAGGVVKLLRDNICNFANSKRLDSMEEAENLGL